MACSPASEGGSGATVDSVRKCAPLLRRRYQMGPLTTFFFKLTFQMDCFFIFFMRFTWPFNGRFIHAASLIGRSGVKRTTYQVRYRFSEMLRWNMDGTRPLDIATKRRKAIGGVKIGSSVAWSHFVRVTIHAAVETDFSLQIFVAKFLVTVCYVDRNDIPNARGCSLSNWVYGF